MPNTVLAASSAPLDAKTVANVFLRRAAREGKSLTPMQLLKLVYLAHGWMLGTHEKPLIRNKVEAWMYGPVIRELYDAICHYKGRPVTETLSAPPSDVPSEEQLEIIRRTYETYKGLDGLQLSTLTHRLDTPWDRVFNHGGGDFTPIPDCLIQEFYKEKLRSSQ